MKHDLSAPLPAMVNDEKAVLGAILLQNDAFGQTVGRIDSDDFSLDSHRRIFKAMERLNDAGVPIDFNTLSGELQKKHELESVGGDAYVTSLTDGLPRVKNISHYVKSVREQSQRRSLILTFGAHSARAYDHSQDVGELVTESMQSLLDVYRKGGKAVPSLQDVAKSCIARMDEQLSIPLDVCVGLSTGIPDMDAKMNGYRRSKYYVIGGKTSSGKSSLALQAIRDNCKRGIHCTMFSIEMTDEDVFNRLASMETGVSLSDMQDARMMEPETRRRVAAAWSEIAQWPFDLRCGAMTLREIKAASRMYISRGSELLFVDYMQYPALRVPGVKGEFERVTEISNGLCEIAKVNNVPVVALSQLSRGDKRDLGKEPTLEDLRMSGQIEQDADLVALLHREKGEADLGHAFTFTGNDKIILAKVRNGEQGTFIPVTFHGPMAMYRERWARGMEYRDRTGENAGVYQ